VAHKHDNATLVLAIEPAFVRILLQGLSTFRTVNHASHPLKTFKGVVIDVISNSEIRKYSAHVMHFEDDQSHVAIVKTLKKMKT
jgi:hypothetical protein